LKNVWYKFTGINLRKKEFHHALLKDIFFYLIFLYNVQNLVCWI